MCKQNVRAMHDDIGYHKEVALRLSAFPYHVCPKQCAHLPLYPSVYSGIISPTCSREKRLLNCSETIERLFWNGQNCIYNRLKGIMLGKPSAVWWNEWILLNWLTDFIRICPLYPHIIASHGTKFCRHLKLQLKWTPVFICGQANERHIAKSHNHLLKYARVKTITSHTPWH